MASLSAAPVAGASSKIRRTQRAPASCTSCTKRKAKCSKTIPCANCIARGEGRQCQLEVVLVRGTTIRNEATRLVAGQEDLTVEGLLAENSRLRAEVAILREETNRSRKLSSPPIGSHRGPEGKEGKCPGEDSSTQEATTEGTPLHDPSHGQPAENDLERMATLTNLLEAGRNGGMKSILDPSDSIYGDSNTALVRSPLDTWLQQHLPATWLPDEISSLEMVQYCSDELGWLYLSSYGPTIVERCRSFLKQASRDGQVCRGFAWYAFYLSLLVLAIHFAPPVLRLRWGLASSKSSSLLSTLQRDPTDSPDPAGTAKTWFDGSVQVLMAGNFMSRPDIDSCHCICNLACVFHVYGPPVFGNVLLSSAVRIAQNLRIDQLSDNEWCEPERGSNQPCAQHTSVGPHIIVTADLAEREARRRLWWFLIYRDWVSFPAGYRYVIAAELYTMPVPLNIDNGQLDDGAMLHITPATVLTDSSFHVARSRLSKIMHAFFGTYRQLGRGDPARHTLAWEIDVQLERLLQDTPFAPRHTLRRENQKSWFNAACHLLRSLIAHKRLLLFREFFALAFTDNRWRAARQQCVDRAGEIVSIRRLFDQPLLGSSETASHYLAAALVLALDFVYFGVKTFTTAEAMARRDQLDELVFALKTTETLEGNAGRMLNQVELLQGLAIEMRADLSNPITVPTQEESALLCPGVSFLPPLEHVELPDSTTDWLDGILQDLGSTEDPSLESAFLASTDSEPKPGPFRTA